MVISVNFASRYNLTYAVWITMKLKTNFLASSAVILAMLASISAGARAKIKCYYASVDSVDVEVIPGGKCTHVLYTFIGLNDQTWRYRFLDGNDSLTRDRIARFVSLKIKFPATKFLIAIGGAEEASGRLSRMAEVPSRRATFVQSIVELVDEYMLHGVDLDWEYPAANWTGGRPIDKQTFPILVQDLRNALKGLGRSLELTIAVDVSEYILNLGYDVPKLCGEVDAVHLMFYDLRGSWDKVADVHSPIHERPNLHEDYRGLNFDCGGSLWIRAGCPRHKLIAGVPFYGVELIVFGKTGPGAQIDQKSTLKLPFQGYIPYSKLCKRFTDSSWKKTFDDEVGVPYMTKGNSFISYDDVRSLKLKTDWVKKYGFGGVSVWSVEQDDYNGDCGQRPPLISTLYENLQNYTVIENM